jgi:hypothetical protein
MKRIKLLNLFVCVSSTNFREFLIIMELEIEAPADTSYFDAEQTKNSVNDKVIHEVEYATPMSGPELSKCFHNLRNNKDGVLNIFFGCAYLRGLEGCYLLL